MIDDADFTPNRDRAIWVEGQLNEALLDRLRPEILELTANSRDPITVFINSRGGFGEVGDGILSLLRRTTEDDARVSKIITVAAPTALSAAANLLSAGDFAIASSQSTLLYHGARYPLAEHERQLTSELIRGGQLVLPACHEMAAAALARNSVRRFLSIVSAHRGLFAQHRANAGDPGLTDLECFQAMLRGKLSPAAQKVLDMAPPLWNSYKGLLLRFLKKLRSGRAISAAHLRKLMIYASVEFEYESNAVDVALAWDGGVNRIGDHFYFLRCYFDVWELVDTLGARQEQSHTRDEIVAEAACSLEWRLFFLALCRALQTGENYITPLDAMWLGLVDTVRPEITSS